MLPIPDVTDADVAFPTASIIPKPEDIPKEFWDGKTQWNAAFRDWFYGGIQASQLDSKPAVDKAKAIRAINTIIGSYSPKHEHKEAACAYLMSEWFESYTKPTNAR